jgi:hypothetical protein
LPARNGELAPPLRAWCAYLDTLGRAYEVLVVEDGSTGRDLSDELMLELPHLRVIHAESRGFGAGIRSGLAVAKFPLVCYAPCQVGYQPTDVGKMLEFMDHVDLVSGYRKSQDRGRRSLSALLNKLLQRILFGMRLKDVACPFKLFRRSIFARIPIQSNSDFVHAEILAKANFLGCVMAEVEVACQAAPSAEPVSLAGEYRKDFHAVLKHPDFGPAVLPVPQSNAESQIQPASNS